MSSNQVFMFNFNLMFKRPLKINFNNKFSMENNMQLEETAFGRKTSNF